MAKYGVNTFISEVHVKEVDFDETFKMPEYQYVVEIVNVYQDNGNGLNEMKIYTEGKLVEFQVGNWKISPIVKMPFSFQGYWDEIELADKYSNVINKRDRPDDNSLFKKKDFILDIKWVFETIKSFENIENAKQYKFIEENFKTKRSLKIYMEGGTYIDTILKFTNEINTEIDLLSELKVELTEKGYQFSRILLNETIDLFNQLKLKKITE